MSEALVAVFATAVFAQAVPGHQIRVEREPWRAGAPVEYGCWVVATDRGTREIVTVAASEAEARGEAERLLATGELRPDSSTGAVPILVYGFATPDAAAAERKRESLRGYVEKSKEIHAQIADNRYKFVIAATLKPELGPRINSKIDQYNTMREMGGKKIGFYVASAPAIEPIEALPSVATSRVTDGPVMRMRLVVEREGKGLTGGYFPLLLLDERATTYDGGQLVFEGARPKGWHEEHGEAAGSRVRVTVEPKLMSGGTIAVHFIVVMRDRAKDGEPSVSTTHVIEKTVSVGESFRVSVVDGGLSANAKVEPNGNRLQAQVKFGPSEPRAVLSGIFRLGNATDRTPVEALRPKR